MKKIAIIGAGACGLMLAAQLNRSNIDCDIFNYGKIGNKILASGNGKCNIANMNYDSRYYHNNPLAHIIVSNHKEELFSLFEILKIFTKSDEEGRMYPISESSLSVLNVLMKNITSNIIDLNVESITKQGHVYFINNIYGPYDKVVVTTGSIAGYKNCLFSNGYLNNLNVKFNDFIPSLVGFKTNLNIKSISGVRSKCIVHLYHNNELIHKEKGEIIFKDNGISGICVMNLSSYYAHLNNKSNTYVSIDLLPFGNYDDLSTVIHPKLLDYVKSHNINPKNMKINITGVYDFEFAQVCSGGIDINEVSNNLSLKKDKNIYCGGEILDVDGLCGGFNLMFAFCCSIKIFKELKNEISGK